MLMPTTIHPTSRTLVAYLDGEVPVEERREISEHLGGCQTCRNELDAIEADLDWFLVLEAAARPIEPPPAAAGLDRLLAAARMWKAAQPEPVAAAESRGSMEERLADAAGLVFGPEVVSADGKSTQSLLSAFLGKRAAKTLMNDIRRRSEPFLNPGIG
jgi:anti-sigma factor RsiW